MMMMQERGLRPNISSTKPSKNPSSQRRKGHLEAGRIEKKERENSSLMSR